MKIEMPIQPIKPTLPPIVFNDLKDGDIFQWKYRRSTEWQPALFLMLNKNISTWGPQIPMAINLSSLESHPTQNPGASFDERDNIIYRVYDKVTLHIPRETNSFP